MGVRKEDGLCILCKYSILCEPPPPPRPESRGVYTTTQSTLPRCSGAHSVAYVSCTISLSPEAVSSSLPSHPIPSQPSPAHPLTSPLSPLSCHPLSTSYRRPAQLRDLLLHLPRTVTYTHSPPRRPPLSLQQRVSTAWSNREQRPIATRQIDDGRGPRRLRLAVGLHPLPGSSSIQHPSLHLPRLWCDHHLLAATTGWASAYRLAETIPPPPTSHFHHPPCRLHRAYQHSTSLLPRQKKHLPLPPTLFQAPPRLTATPRRRSLLRTSPPSPPRTASHLLSPAHLHLPLR